MPQAGSGQSGQRRRIAGAEDETRTIPASARAGAADVAPRDRNAGRPAPCPDFTKPPGWWTRATDAGAAIASAQPARHGKKSLETTLYAPVKAFLETLGFTVKGEVGGCDLFGLREGEPPLVVICELKLSFNLELVLQGVERAAAADEVWLAAKLSKKGKGRESDARFRNLCRRLGFGLLGVSERGMVEILVSPDAPSPRRDGKKRSRLLREHQRRRGDPTAGGGSRAPVMTAYRQAALAMAAAMVAGPMRPRDLKSVTPDAPKILQRDVYGWFVRQERGIYTLSGAGHAALLRWPQDAPAEV